MEEKKTQPQEVLRIELSEPVSIPYSAGLYMGKFLRDLKENGKIMGIICQNCKRILFPPQCVCSVCHADNVDANWVELGPEGVLSGFMNVMMSAIDPKDLELRTFEYPIATITPDAPEGRYCSFWHLVGERDISKLKVGMRVRAVLKPKEKREGRLQDILYWEPIKE